MIHYQERLDNGEIKDHYFTKEEFREEFTSGLTGELWPCHDEWLNNVGKWIDDSRVVTK